MNVLIVDHSFKYIELIRSLIKEYLYDVQRIEYAQFLCDAKNLIHKYSPKLIISELNLPDGCGTDILETFVNTPAYVICQTSNTNYAIDAIRYNTVKDYLIKPVNLEEFKCSLNRFTRFISNEESIRSGISHPEKKQLKKLKYKANGTIEFIELNNIIRIEAMRSYCRAVLNNKKSIVYSKSLSKLEKELPAGMFFRVHKSHLVNLSYVEEISRNGSFIIKMNDDSHIPLSRDKKNTFFSTFEYFIQ